MAQTQVVMPKMSMTMTEGEVVEITVKVGDQISQGQVVAVVGTDKTDMEVESDHEGEVIEILAGSGDVLPVGAGLILLETKGEDLLAGLFGTAGDAPTPVAESAPAAPIAQVEQPVAEAAVVAEPVIENAGPVLAMPGARKLAQELGIDLRTVTAKSETGVIKQADLAAGVDPARQDRARVQIAKVVETSKSIPQLSVTGTVAIKTKLPKDFVSRATQLLSAWKHTLDKNPKLNSVYQGESFATPAQVRAAVLLKTQLGFVSPVIELSGDWHEGVAKILQAARLNKIALENLQGATTSVTDLSEYPITQASTLLMAGQSSGINLGKVREVASGFEIAVTIVLDHRVADAGDAAEAMVAFERALNEVLDGNGEG